MMLGLRALLSRFYRGEISANIVGRPKIWYALSGALLTISILGIVIRGLNFGVEFTGGSVFSFPTSGSSISQVRQAVESTGPTQVIVQQAGDNWRVTTESLQSTEANEVKESVAKSVGIAPGQVSSQLVGASWGGEISKKAWQALIVFMLGIIAYLTIAFEWRMAVGAMVALVHDLVITAGIYAWSGFEVTPATLLGFLTILGYSLYDAVVVFDMIKEVTKPLGVTSKITYSQAANQALNNTLVRSLNTSLVAILPVAAILFIGTTLFGAGTLKDLSLALFVGMIVGTYSSICVATPLLVQLKERQPKYRELRERLAARAASPKRQAREARRAERAADPAAAEPAPPVSMLPDEDVEDEGPSRVGVSAPRRVVQQGPRQQPRRSSRRGRGGSGSGGGKK